MNPDPFAWLIPLRAWMSRWSKDASLLMLLFVLLVGIAAYVAVFVQALLMMTGVLMIATWHVLVKEWAIALACLTVVLIWLVLR